MHEEKKKNTNVKKNYKGGGFVVVLKAQRYMMHTEDDEYTRNICVYTFSEAFVYG